MPLSLPGVSIWRLRLHPDPRLRPRSWSEWLHSRLGPALHERACALSCGEGPCQLGRGCAFERCYGLGEQRRDWRLDCSDLEHPQRGGDRDCLRLVLFSPNDEGLLLAALLDVLRPHSPEAPERLAHGGDAPPSLPPSVPLSLEERASSLQGPLRLDLRSLSLLKRDSRPIPEPGPLDVLHATRQRARQLGLDTAAWPRFEEQLIRSEDASLEPGLHLHRSARQPELAPIPGVRAAWRIEASPAQAAWLALSEVLGVGGKTTLGFGVVRGVREG